MMRYPLKRGSGMYLTLSPPMKLMLSVYTIIAQSIGYPTVPLFYLLVEVREDSRSVAS